MSPLFTHLNYETDTAMLQMTDIAHGFFSENSDGAEAWGDEEKNLGHNVPNMPQP